MTSIEIDWWMRQYPHHAKAVLQRVENAVAKLPRDCTLPVLTIFDALYELEIIRVSLATRGAIPVRLTA